MEATLTATASDTQRRGIVPANRKFIAVLTPTLGVVSMLWHAAMDNLIYPMNMGRSFIPMKDRVGNDIGELRNKLVQVVLDCEQQQNIEIEYVFWVDDDVILSRPAMLALMAHDRDIASGVYFSKFDPSEPLIFDGPASGTARFVPDSVTERWGWSQGLSLVRLEVFKRMRDDLDLGVDKYGNPCWFKKPEFGLTPEGHLNQGGTEDFHFFENASKLGYRAIVDSTKHAFGWHYDHVKDVGYPRKQWEQFLRQEPIVWPKKGGGEVVWA